MMIKILALLAFVLARFHGSDLKILPTTFPGIFRTFRSSSSTPTITSSLGVKVATESVVGDVCGRSRTVSEGTYVDINDDDKNYNKMDNSNDNFITASTSNSNSNSNNNNSSSSVDNLQDHHHHHLKATNNSITNVTRLSDNKERDEQVLLQAMKSAMFPCTITLIKHKQKHKHYNKFKSLG